MKRLQTAFATGVLVLIPLIATLHILIWFVDAVDVTARTYLFTNFLPFDFKGLGLILAIAIILITGLLTQNFIGRSLVSFLDSLIKRVPLGGGIYSAIKKFLNTVFNPRSDKFKGVVLVPFPSTGLYSVGFRTGNPDPKLVKKTPRPVVNVFVPCTPNPTSGFYLLVEEKDLIPVDMTVQEAFRIVISMGIVTSEEASTP